ncbi:7-carboxy-7-deazaguanine synthase QueE [Helicobacter sp. 13S00477-4]|uniref:7-carboxy-7-deazaguanine synthase QueE n=1 Tax=Helicobacter sp. 13S00477-4 TaxID=1905759 RepID=UPI000BA782C2|nr:7-carboxy-7-deazaguanine synthase QueE [Helicobacter sp. 13S00477-4]PAF50563.1 6-pyruvoyl tetrahydropterin synthase [Helicobacter sp. 13S00477-4]
MLPVSEIFYSFQGEGEFIGTPSVFLRLGGCNLKCIGFGIKNSYEGNTILGCDSIYAANGHFSKEWKSYDSSQILIDKIQNFSSNKFDIVITGGEPSLHFKNPVLLKTIEYFLQKGHRISIESNGSIDFVFNDILKELHFTLSIKLSNSGESYSKRIKTKVIQNIIDNAKSVVFKFVLNAQMCENGTALKEIEELLKTLKLKSNKIYLMPQGISRKELDENIKKIYPICLQKGFCLSDRLHIRIWGNKRGV